MTLSKLEDVNKQPDVDVIAALEDALKLAKEGKLRSIAMVGAMRGNATFTSIDTSDLGELIAQVAFLQHKLCAMQARTVVDEADL